MTRILLFTAICCLSNLFCFSQENKPTGGKFLMVLDIQEYSTNGKLDEASAQKIIDSVNYVINAFDTNKVIYIKTSHKALNLSLSYPFIYVSFDTAAMRLDERMNLVNENIFTKDNSSAFSIEDLNDFLIQNNAKEIVIIGLMAEECVFETLLEGEELGYTMFVIPEAILAESPTSKDKTLKKLSEKGVNPVGIHSLIP